MIQVRHDVGIFAFRNLERQTWGLQQNNLSLNGDEQDTFMILHMQLVQDHTARASSMQVEYYLTLSMKSCRVAFKIAYSIGNMRLEKIQNPLVKVLWVPFNNKTSICKGLIGHHVITWMDKYFSKQCDIMPTTGRLHLSDNFTLREVYQSYKDAMLLDSVPYIQY